MLGGGLTWWTRLGACIAGSPHLRLFRNRVAPSTMAYQRLKSTRHVFAVLCSKRWSDGNSHDVHSTKNLHTRVWYVTAPTATPIAN
jgi:hypothetical protein